MKAFVLVLSLVAILFQTSAWAADEMSAYMERCTVNGKYSQQFCECALKAFSDKYRETQKRQLVQLEHVVAAETKGLLADPAISEDKLDAVCGLYDLAQEYDQKAGIATTNRDHKARQKFFSQKVAYETQKKDLAMSYGAKPQSAGALVQGNYCRNRNQLNQIKKDQTAGEATLYPEVQRMLEVRAYNMFNFMFREGHRAKCPK